MGQEFRIIQGQKINKVKQELAKDFRREMTPAEKLLWNHLRNNQINGYHFRRQQVIEGFIIDFYCCRARLAVEVDGGVHETTQFYDLERDRILKLKGIQIIRFQNEQIFHNLPEVLNKILAICKNS